MRIPRRFRLGAILAAPVVLILVLSPFLGFRFQDLGALGRHLLHRRPPTETVWQVPKPTRDLADFALGQDGRMLALCEGGLWDLEGGSLRPLAPSQGLLHLYLLGPDGGLWASGTYHRVLAWYPKGGLRHVLNVRGVVRGVQARGELLAVGFEGEALRSGQVGLFRRRTEGVFESDGVEVSIGMDRWSGFDLSPNGLKVLANLPGGKGVGVWSTEDGRLLASWPAERLARILHFVDEQRVVFDVGPAQKIREAAYAHPGNRLVQARVDASEEPTVITRNFAAVLSSTRWPSSSRITFSDMEGLVRVVSLDSFPRLTHIFAPKGRGIPWRVQPAGEGLWVLIEGETTRVERFRLN